MRSNRCCGRGTAGGARGRDGLWRCVWDCVRWMVFDRIGRSNSSRRGRKGCFPPWKNWRKAAGTGRRPRCRCESCRSAIAGRPSPAHAPSRTDSMQPIRQHRQPASPICPRPVPQTLPDMSVQGPLERFPSDRNDRRSGNRGKKLKRRSNGRFCLIGSS